MAKRLIELRIPIFAVLWDENVTKSSVRASLDLKDSTWKILEDLIPTLEPLAEATELLTKEDEPTISQVYVVLKWLLDTLVVSNIDSTAIKKLKQDIASGLQNRFGLDNEGGLKSDRIPNQALTAVALDPRHKALRCLSDTQRKTMTDHIEKLVAETRGQSGRDAKVKTEPGVETEPVTPKPKRAKLAEMMQGDVVAIDLTKTDQSNTEYAAFLREQVSILDPLEWWRCNSLRFPTLAKLAQQYLSIPATEVPSERAFSAAGATVTKLRAALEPEVVDACVFLHKNHKLQVSYPF